MSIPAGVVGVLFEPALVALLDMTTEFGAAAYLDVIHGLHLFIWHRARLSVLLAVCTKYICHFRFFSVLLGKLPFVSFFHWRALLFFVKVVKRAF